MYFLAAAAMAASAASSRSPERGRQPVQAATAAPDPALLEELARVRQERDDLLHHVITLQGQLLRFQESAPGTGYYSPPGGGSISGAQTPTLAVLSTVPEIFLERTRTSDGSLDAVAAGAGAADDNSAGSPAPAPGSESVSGDLRRSNACADGDTGGSRDTSNGSASGVGESPAAAAPGNGGGLPPYRTRTNSVEGSELSFRARGSPARGSSFIRSGEGMRVGRASSIPEEVIGETPPEGSSVGSPVGSGVGSGQGSEEGMFFVAETQSRTLQQLQRRVSEIAYQGIQQGIQIYPTSSMNLDEFEVRKSQTGPVLPLPGPQCPTVPVRCPDRVDS